MFQPYLIAKNGELRRQALLQEAKLARQMRQIKSVQSAVKQGKGNFLQIVSYHIQSHTQVISTARGEV